MARSTDEEPGNSGEDERARRRRIRRAGLSSGAATGLMVGGLLLIEVLASPLRAWAWATVPFVAAGGWGAGWRTARARRVRATRDESLRERETLLSSYWVRSPHDMRSVQRSRYDDPSPYELRLTNRRLQLWEGSALLWAHPWAGLRLSADGKMLLVHHEGDTIARMLVMTPSGEPRELLLAAARLGARADEHDG